MRRRPARAFLSALLALPLVASCATGGDGTGASGSGSSGSGGSTGAGDAGSASGDSSGAATAMPRGDGDPCDPDPPPGFKFYECETVGWVDLDGDGTADPIGVTIHGNPSMLISAFVGGRRIEKELEDELTNALGPGAGTGIAPTDLIHRAFFGAYDFAGDGTPLLVVWSDEGDDFNSFHVYHYSGSDLVGVTPPDEGFGGRTYDWVHKVDADHPSHRCTGDPVAGLDVMRPNGGTLSVMPHEFSSSERSAAFLTAGEETQVGYTPQATNDLGIDCEDLAQHARPN